MISEAKDCLYEDILNAVKYNELHEYIRVVEDKTAKVSDIPEFLKEMCEEETDGKILCQTEE
jgi:hypothetical protein